MNDASTEVLLTSQVASSLTIASRVHPFLRVTVCGLAIGGLIEGANTSGTRLGFAVLAIRVIRRGDEAMLRLSRSSRRSSSRRTIERTTLMANS